MQSAVVISASGAAIGFVAAFLGIGGGVLIMPLLTVMFGLGHRRAVGTSLGVVMFVVSAGIVVDVFRSSEATRPALLAAVCIVPFAVLAARAVAPWIRHVPVRVLRRIFAVVLLLAAAKMLGVPPFSGTASQGWLSYQDMSVAGYIALPVLGLFVGTISALVGIGGGVVVIPALGLLFFDLTMLQCRATSLLVVAPTAFMGFSRHLAHGTANLDYVRRLAPWCILGSLIGSYVAHSVDTSLFQTLFGAFLLLVAVRLFLTAPPEPAV